MPSLDIIHRNSDLHAAFPLMQQLRPHLSDPAEFVRQIQRQFTAGYQLTACRKQDQWLGLIGFRISENLLYGKFLYVDDLIVSPECQHQGIGRLLIDHSRARAQQAHCHSLVLDTGLHMPYAQRFYFSQGLLAKGMHFVEQLQGEQS